MKYLQTNLLLFSIWNNDRIHCIALPAKNIPLPLCHDDDCLVQETRKELSRHYAITLFLEYKVTRIITAGAVEARRVQIWTLPSLKWTLIKWLLKPTESLHSKCCVQELHNITMRLFLVITHCTFQLHCSEKGRATITLIITSNVANSMSVPKPNKFFWWQSLLTPAAITSSTDCTSVHMYS